MALVVNLTYTCFAFAYTNGYVERKVQTVLIGMIDAITKKSEYGEQKVVKYLKGTLN